MTHVAGSMSSCILFKTNHVLDSSIGLSTQTYSINFVMSRLFSLHLLYFSPVHICRFSLPSEHVFLPPLFPSPATSFSKTRSEPFILLEIFLIPTGTDPALESGPESCLVQSSEGSLRLFWFGKNPRVLE